MMYYVLSIYRTRDWTGDYITDFRDLLPGKLELESVILHFFPLQLYQILNNDYFKFCNLETLTCVRSEMFEKSRCIKLRIVQFQKKNPCPPHGRFMEIPRAVFQLIFPGKGSCNFQGSCTK